MIPRIHDKYLLKQFVRILLFSILTFSVIYVTVDIFEELDNFIDKEASMGEILRYYLYSIPFILTYITPVSLLLATIFSMGVMSRRNELTALISNGISLTRISVPIIVASTVCSLGIIVFNETIVASANTAKNETMLYDIEGRKRENPLYKENLHYLGEGGFIYLAGRYNHMNRSLFDVVLQQFDNNTLIRRVDAKRAVWDGNKWIFSNGFERTFSPEGEKVGAFETLSIPELVEKPEDFIKKEIDVENMSYNELKEYISKVRKSGGNVEQYLVDLYFKFSFPLSGAIFVLLGIAFTSGKRSQSIATGFGITLAVSFLYYGILRTGRTLGHNGILPPILAAQLGNIIFLIVGSILFRKANR